MWNGDLRQMAHLADRVADLAEVPSQAAKSASAAIGLLIQEEFDEGQDPYGDTWKPLAEATVKRGRGFPPLTDTSGMRASVLVRPLPSAGIAVTVDHPAEDHQTGWSGPQGTGPARPILPARGELPDSWEEAIEEAVAAAVKRRA